MAVSRSIRAAARSGSRSWWPGRSRCSACAPLTRLGERERLKPGPLASVGLGNVGPRPLPGTAGWSNIGHVTENYVIRRALTGELSMKDSPVRQFFDGRFAPGLRDVQARYRAEAGALVVRGVPQPEANAGTIGTAADWLLRFLVHPMPSLHLAALGARLCGRLPALQEIAGSLGYAGAGAETYRGPRPGSRIDPEYLNRACWALALLSEVYRSSGMALAGGPVTRLPDESAGSLLAVAPDAGIAQLTALRAVMEAVLLPELAGRQGTWALGPTLAGSELMAGDADLIAAGLLLDLKVYAKPVSLARADLWQLLGYALMDYIDEFALTDVAIFAARYGYLVTWNLEALVSELADASVSVADLRAEFRDLLEACQAA
jgi:hypothetical protein